MKSKNRKRRLESRIDDHSRGPQGKDRSNKVVWGAAEARPAYRKPGSNKK